MCLDLPEGPLLSPLRLGTAHSCARSNSSTSFREECNLDKERIVARTVCGRGLLRTISAAHFLKSAVRASISFLLARNVKAFSRLGERTFRSLHGFITPLTKEKKRERFRKDEICLNLQISCSA